MKLANFLSVLLIAYFITSCAVGQKINYSSVKMDLFQVESNSIDLLLLDHRETVVDGSRKPSFCGYMRTGTGIAYQVHTVTKKSFLEEIGENIVSSLNKFNTNANLIYASSQSSEAEAKQNIFLGNGEKKMLFIFEEFHTDGYGIQFLHYKFELFIFDSDTKLVYYKKYNDKEKLGGNVAFGAGGYKRYMPEKVMSFFENLFIDPEILTILNN